MTSTLKLKTTSGGSVSLAPSDRVDDLVIDPVAGYYLHDGTGATSRTVTSKLNDWVSVKDFGAVGDGVTDDTVAINTAIDSVSTYGGTVYFPTGEYLVSKDPSTVALDTMTSIGCAILLKSWVNLVGAGVATLSGAQTGTRIKLADSQNCHVLANFDDSLSGLSGSMVRNLTVNANRAGNLVAGSCYFVGSLFSNSGLDSVKLGYSRDHGIQVFATSTPIWVNNVFVGSAGKNGVHLNGATTHAANIANLQVDNAGVNGTGEAGFYVDVGSTENTNINLINYRYEHNVTTEPTASSLGVQLNNLAGATINIIGSYGFSNTAAATDFIKVTGSVGKVNIIGTTCNSNYDNVYNDAVSGRVVAYSTSGIPGMFESLDIWQQARFKNKSGSTIATLKTNTSGQLEINNPVNGTAVNDVVVYGPSIVSATFDESTNTGTNRGRIDTNLVQLTGVDASTARIFAGPGSPNGRGDASAPVGSLYLRTDGGASTSVYVKETGTGNTGWVAK